MISELLSEDEFRRIYAKWRYENDRGVFIPPGITPEEFASDFPLPDEPSEHTQSTADSDGCITTLLKGEIRLSGWQTKSGNEEKVFTYYKVIKTPDGEGTEPFTAGYIAVI